jgi:outer membrane protein assembly factor BamB
MRTLLLSLLILSLAGAAAGGENWPGFRGPHGDGHADAAKLPRTWSEKENIVWKTAIHDKGWSSPVVWGDQVWVTTAKVDGKELFAVCVDRASGKIVHDVKVFDVEEPSSLWQKFNSFASPTPAIEEGRVYVSYGTYGTACLDTKTGKTLWTRRDLHCDHFRGAASSPILYDDLLFLHFDGVDVQYIVALDKKSGKTVWKKDRGIDFKGADPDFKKAYATPAVLTIGGKPQLVSPAASATTAYDPKTGEQLWRVYHGGMNVTATPLSGQGKVFLCTGDGGMRLLAVSPDGSDGMRMHIDWTMNKGNVPSHPSPILVDDLLYMAANTSGVITCVEAKTGEVVSQQRVGGTYWASPIYADGRLYFFDEAGNGHVIAAGRTGKKLATNKLNDGCRASPAVAGNALFVRTLTHLYRMENKE